MGLVCLELGPDNQRLGKIRWIKKHVSFLFYFFAFLHRFGVSYRVLELKLGTLLQRTLHICQDTRARIQCISSKASVLDLFILLSTFCIMVLDIPGFINW